MMNFKRLLITENLDGTFTNQIVESTTEDLPTNDLLIKVHYSSLNFKDALSATGNKGVTRTYPHTPGIDAAGEIISSNSSEFKPGDKVIVTGHDLGMNTSGGFSEYISVPAHWAIPLPDGLSLHESMIIGTAGLTAAMCIDKLQTIGVKSGKVIVSGATGGVGSMAIMMLNRLGYEPIAFSRKESSVEWLKELGATEVIHSMAVNEKVLLKPLFSGGIDTVGGNILSNIIKQILPNGGVASCGMALSPNFDITVFPFILRGISLLGVDSAEATDSWKANLWSKLANEWKPEKLSEITKTVSLEELWPEIEKIKAGKQLGRVVVKLT
ncbi:YhdH/YhfP family quinone oxidoreductase [Lacihabitans lacunae]|uniref:YhdH/YhfP family quinone oxidoreductase n=1 Tax=Lacihabitans lacunae TaxID=1028214 RepID=A0ABV7YUP1_9BACT